MFKFILIGKDNLLIECGAYLLEKHHQIVNVVSPSSAVRVWCERNNLSWVATLDEIADKSIGAVDYIFSIVNQTILKKTQLQIARFGAINYHDSLLPKYAGLNATTWALVNNEKLHGITWHVIDEGIDTGDIVYQKSFMVSSNDTALSLNLQCFEEAIRGFKKIIRRIEKGDLIKQVQPQKDRSYYGREHVLPNLGFIDWNTAQAASIECLCRALTFGNYSNEVGTLKLYLGDSFLIITEVQLLNNIDNNAASGIVLAIREDGIIVSTTTQPILLKNFMTMHGEKLSAQDIILNYGIKLNDKLPTISHIMIQHNQNLYQHALKNEEYWLSELSKITEHNTFAANIFNHTVQAEFKPIMITGHVNIKEQRNIYLIASVVLYLYRLNDSQNCSLFVSQPAEILFSELWPLCVDLSGDFTLKDALNIISEKFEMLYQHGRYLKDIFARRPGIVPYSEQKNITVSISDEETKVQNNSLLHFNIEKNTGKLSYSYQFHLTKKNLALSYLLSNISLHIDNIHTQLIHNSDIPISELNFLTVDEQRKLFPPYSEWNQTEKEYPENKAIHQLFEEQVEKTPDNIAVVYEDIRLTYNELNQKANQLAHYLRETYAIQGDDLIALCLDKSEQMLIVILGIWKSGAAYIPMDPDYPKERLVHILGNAQVKVVVASKVIGVKLKTFINEDHLSTAIELIDSDVKKIHLEHYSKINPISKITSQNLAYVIYTSGTTGKPKGVMIEHKGVINLISDLSEKYNMVPSDRIALSANYIFDSSIEQILMAIANGGTIYVCSDNIRKDINLFTEYCVLNRITHLHFTPAYAENVDFSKIISLKKLILGGDSVSDKLFKKLYSQNYKLINTYGPTEATITSLISLDSNNIGWPLANIKVYILGAALQPIPIGAVGELYIAGVGLARGYLNMPELTAERFIPNPFQSEAEKQAGKNTRLYKTGDLVRYLPDGNVEYIGRNDFQVKIRGLRIELGEIETKLASYPEIKQAVALAKEHLDQNGLPTGNKYIVGYYVANDRLNQDAILDYLSEHLPEYMLPTALVWLDRLPLTLTGKLDRQALPDPEWTNASNYLGPRNDLESQVCAMYADVLGLPLEQVGIRDDFFRLGGDSIHSIQLVSRLRQYLGLRVTVKEIFTHKTVEKLYNKVLANQLSPVDVVLREEGILGGDVGLLPIQSWFFSQVTDGLIKKPGHWNQSFLIKTGKLDRELLQHSLTKLIEYHDAFRLHYRLNEKDDYQQFYDSAVSEIKLFYLDVSQISDDERQVILTRWQSDFELLSTDPLYRIGYMEGYSDGCCRIFFALHHLLIDVVSWRIIVHDLQMLYEKLLHAKKNNQLHAILQQSSETLLGRKGTSYRQWIEQIQVYKERYLAEKNNWREIIAVENPLSSFVINQSTQQHAEFSLDSESTRLLLTKCGHAYHTEINDLLLAGFGLALAQITRNSTHYITLEGHGREEVIKDTDVTRTVGWFTTMYPVKLTVDLNNIAQSIIMVKETLRKIPHRGIGYGALIGYEVTELPKVSFNYLGQIDQGYGGRGDIKKRWRLTNEASGMTRSTENQDSNIINANGAVSEGKLHFQVEAKLSLHDLEQLVSAFKQQLIGVIQYTASLHRSYLTASDVDYIISQEYLDQLQANRVINQVYLANSLQQGFIYHALNQGEEDTAYRVQLVFHYGNCLNPELLKIAWQGAIQHYPSLRLRFAWGEELVQIIDQHQDLAWQYWDISLQDVVQQQAFMDDLVRSDHKNPYRLDKDNLLRVFLIKCKDDDYNFILSSHHIIFDGWSIPLLFDFVHQLYRKLENSNHLQRKKIIVNIQEEETYTSSQHYLQQNDRLSEEYWRQQLARIEDCPDLSGLLNQDKRQLRLIDYHLIVDKAEEAIIFKDGFYNQIKNYGSEQGVTINVLLQYCWHKLLSAYGHAKTTIVGTTIAGRNLPINDIEDSVGLYINTLPMIVLHDECKTISEELRILQDVIHEMNSHSNINLTRLQSFGRRLFDNLFVYENYPDYQATKESSIQLRLLKSFEELDYPLAILASEQNNQIQVIIKYAGELFSKDTIHQLLNGLQELLKQVTAGIDQPSSLSYLNSIDYKKIINDWNKTEKSYPQNKTINQLFEDQVEKTPDNISIMCEDTQLTYRELNRRANQLAHYLIQTYAIQKDDLIALHLDRGEQMLITILAVLKSGAAYVPMDPRYPEERTVYILNDTRAKVVLANEIYKENLQSVINGNHLQTKIELIDCSEMQRKIISYPTFNSIPKITCHNLAYVIYTSGTTGKPKGVMIEHSGVVSLVKGENYIKVRSDDVVLQLADMTFDAATFEIYISLLNGLTLVIPNNKLNLITDISKLEKFLIVNKVSILWLTKTLFDQLYLLSETIFANINYLLVGGEALDYRLIRKLLLSEYKPTHLINGYGPTENTTFSCTYEIKKENITQLTRIPIGKPLNNRTAYILDNNLNPLPVGAIGELCVGGAGLARGYLNFPELTAEKFIVNPFRTESEKQTGKNARLYKTGDLVRYLADGNIEYMSRNDFQVKIRGFRIEPDEVETILVGYPGIKQAVVLVKENSHKSLVGYYVANEHLDNNAILKYLSQHLPEYMLPAAVIRLDKLPLTINGKLDRQALPNPEWTSALNYVAPRSDLESRVCAVYAEVLGLPMDKISVHDDFFRLGGNSILAIKLISRLNSKIFGDTKLNVEGQIKIAQLFRHKTISSLCETMFASEIGYQEIQRYGQTNHNRLPKMIFIHPSIAGSEVYQGFADLLAEQYDCIGIDNYNIHHQDQITTLEGIASHYLSQLNHFCELSEPIYLCGWSLGGQIALEMAYLLEKRGYSHVIVICLDSILLDERMHKYNNELDEIEIKHGIFKKIANDYAFDYAANVVKAYDSEKRIWLSENHPLIKTKVILYKALYEAEDTEFNSQNKSMKELRRYILSLPSNNIDKICQNITVINLFCQHGNIIEEIVKQCILDPAFFSKNLI